MDRYSVHDKCGSRFASKMKTPNSRCPATIVIGPNRDFSRRLDGGVDHGGVDSPITSRRQLLRRA
jgi:hypothetical protein